MRKVAALQIAAIKIAEEMEKEAGPTLAILQGLLGAGARKYGQTVEKGRGLFSVAKVLGAKNKYQIPVVGSVDRIMK